ncbi:MAG: hemerythrin domain-containing protein [Stenotrophobium sp.]
MSALNWVTQWFGGATSAGARTSLKAIKAQSRINYSPTLIGALEQDHADLLRLYGEVDQLLRKGAFEPIAAALTAFKTRLDVHLLNENLRFYCYLEERLSGSPLDLETMKEFRHEMNSIARGVSSFVRKYQMAGVSLANHRNFTQEFHQIGALLTQRIEREESGLYTLYTP